MKLWDYTKKVDNVTVRQLCFLNSSLLEILSDLEIGKSVQFYVCGMEFKKPFHVSMRNCLPFLTMHSCFLLCKWFS